jgi:hypothetical protein
MKYKLTADAAKYKGGCRKNAPIIAGFSINNSFENEAYIKLI